MGKNTSLAGIEESGIGEARAGKFRLYERHELAPDWSPVQDDRLTVWEATQHLAAALERSETEAAELMHVLGGYSDRARQLAYLLYQKANDRGWAQEAGAYNGLVCAWPSLRTSAATAATAAAGPAQQTLHRGLLGQEILGAGPSLGVEHRRPLRSLRWRRLVSRRA